MLGTPACHQNPHVARQLPTDVRCMSAMHASNAREAVGSPSPTGCCHEDGLCFTPLQLHPRPGPRPSHTARVLLTAHPVRACMQLERCTAHCTAGPMRRCCACWSASARWTASRPSSKGSRTARRRCLALATGKSARPIIPTCAVLNRRVSVACCMPKAMPPAQSMRVLPGLHTLGRSAYLRDPADTASAVWHLCMQNLAFHLALCQFVVLHTCIISLPYVSG